MLGAPAAVLLVGGPWQLRYFRHLDNSEILAFTQELNAQHLNNARFRAFFLEFPGILATIKRF